MSCCGSAAALTLDPVTAEALHGDRVDPTFVRKVAPGRAHIDFLVPDMHCAGCISAIERALGSAPGVTAARANLTSHRVGVDFEAATGSPDAMLAAIEGLGYSARPFDAAILDAADSDGTSKELVLAMAVAGFAAGNIMLLSVSVWSGATDATRDLFHWISALIALPAIAFAGRPFFRSAWRALSAGGLNMDVPITIGVLLASAMSLFETATHGEHAWFDAAVGLLFFLLVGRFLDHRMRDVARSAAARLLSLSARSAMRLDPDGTAIHVPIGEILPGNRVRVAAGERLPVDGTVLEGRSDIDRSMLTGEAEPEAVLVGGSAGQWSVTVNDYAAECAGTSGCSGGANDGRYDVTILMRPTVPTTGTVDLAFYLVTSTLSAASAQSDSKVARFLNTLGILYARAGLCIGNVTFYDVPAWAKTKYATGVKADKTGPCDELDQMFTLSKTGENTLNFFLVDSIGQTGGLPAGAQIVGIDGAIPGPSSIGGTVKSGAVVNVSDLHSGSCSGSPNYNSCGADETAYITAHEGGHWMGLYHVTESIGSFYDPLSDTPTCDCTSCTGAASSSCYVPGQPVPSSPTRLEGKYCNQAASSGCAGADHLMFWIIDETSVGNVSAEQGKVIRSNPVIQ